jgi:hypothetical protein
MFLIRRFAFTLPTLLWLSGNALMLAALTGNARANIPGGGTGTGANVSLVDNGNGTVTMANGLVTALIEKSTAQILQLTYNGVQVTDGGTASNSAFYWQGSDQTGAEQTGTNCIYTVVANPATNGGSYAEISLLDLYANNPTTADAVDVDFHFSMKKGSPGIYVTQIDTRTAAAPAGPGNPFSMACKFGADIFQWLSEDTGRNLLMNRVADWDAATFGINNAPQEVGRMTTGLNIGTFECKYDYSGQLGSLNVWGWSSTAHNIGIWMMAPSHEYYDCGPMHREILCQIEMINNPFNGGHYGFHADSTFAAGETWQKVYGPYFIYFNQVPAGAANPQTALFADAQAQVAAEQSAWPYSWFQNPAYVQQSGRGTVTGQIVINDNGNPNASAAGLWVGLAQTPSSTTNNADFQFFAKGYQYWVKTDANGNFTIPHVIAGSNYILYSFGPGAIGLFASTTPPGNALPVSLNTPATPFTVTVTAGGTTSLGTVTWTPTRVGATVFEIGVPDRDTTEFLHGNDYWHGDPGTAANPAVNWAPFQDYATDFPGGLVYTVGTSQWAADWDYAQPTVFNATTGNLDPTTQKIFFDLPSAPASGAAASIYFAIAADYSGPVIVTVNGNNVTSPTTGFFPAFSSSASADDAMIRMGSQGVFCDYRLNFSGSVLHAGQNEIDLNMRKGGYFSNSILYDYIRLELAGYVPPPPASVAVTPGDTQVQLSWAPVPGATSYVIKRALSSGGPFITIAANATSPVAGNGTASFTDYTVTNGLTYYYTVSSANPGGSSAVTASLAAQPVQTFAQWIAAYFPGQNSAQIVGATATPNNDSLPNLIKYFFALDPTMPQPSSILTAAPDGHGNLVLTYRLSKNLSGVSYSIQQSTDLATWADTGVVGAQVSDQGGYYIMQATVPQGGTPVLFLRLWVSLSS